MLFRLAYLAVTNTFAALRLLPMGDRGKDIEILALRHQITVLERQLGADAGVRFAPEDRALLAALLTSLPREILRLLRAPRPPGHRVAPAPQPRGAEVGLHRQAVPGSALHPPAGQGADCADGAGESGWGHRRIQGELARLGCTIAVSTVWEILHRTGIDPGPGRVGGSS